MHIVARIRGGISCHDKKWPKTSRFIFKVKIARCQKKTEREMFKSRFVLFCSTLLFQPLCDRLATMTSRMKKKRKIFNTTGTDGSFVVLLFTTCFKHMSFHTPIPTGLFWGFFPFFFCDRSKRKFLFFRRTKKSSDVVRVNMMKSGD